MRYRKHYEYDMGHILGMSVKHYNYEKSLEQKVRELENRVAEFLTQPHITITNFIYTDDMDIEELAEELEFYRQQHKERKR